MSAAVEVVQSLYAAFGRGDIPAVLDTCTDDVEWIHRGSLELPQLGRFVGKQALLQWFGHIAASESIQIFEPREFLAGADHVTVLGWERTLALPGGGVFETDWTHVFSLRDGRVSRFIGMYDTAAVARARAQIGR